jgi:hypothetical protein
VILEDVGDADSGLGPLDPALHQLEVGVVAQAEVVQPRSLGPGDVTGVKLDPTQIAKAMWVDVSRDGRWAWSSSGTDLLAYDTAQITASRAGPAGAPLAAFKRIAGVLRAPSVSGATFLGDRLYLAFDRGSYVQVLSYPVDPATGDVGTAWRLEIQRTKTATLWETEGLAVANALGGTLHWQIQPQSPFYSRILHFVPSS